MTAPPKASPLPLPPPGTPWDGPIAEAPLAFVDLEMTGLDPVKDRVVEICIERVVGGESVGRLSSLVRPTERAGQNAHVHGLTEDVLADAPTFADLADQVVALLEGAVFVAHAASWDAKFMRAELVRAGREPHPFFYIDTLKLSRRTFGLPSHSLTALSEHFGFARPTHRAEGDVAALRALFDRCIGELRPLSVRDLWEVRVAERKARPVVIEACQLAVTTGEPVDVTYRPSHKGASTFRMVVTAVDCSLDPPRVVGYLVPGRGRRELRADRILRVDPATSP